MLVQPYDTTICQHYNPKVIVSAVRRAHLENPLPEVTTPRGNEIANTLFIPPKTEYDHIPLFTQPIVIGEGDSQQWVIDGRPFMRWDRRSDTYRLVAENDFSFQCIRLALSKVLQDDGKTPFYRLGEIPAKVFVRWVSQALAQRYGLSLEHQINTSIILGYYYYSQMSKNRTLSEEDKQLRAKTIANLVTGITPRQVLFLGEELPPLETANRLAIALAKHSGSMRLDGLKFADLYTIIASSWIGVNARENVGVALEHIPTWIALLYSALDERSYRKTIITQRAESAINRQSDRDVFTKNVFRLVATQFA